MKLVINLTLFFAILLLFSCEKSVFLEKESAERAIVGVAQGNRGVINDVYVHTFPELRIGQKSSATFTIYNGGNKDLEIGNVSSDSKFFTIIPPTKRILAPKEAVYFTLTFTPTKWGQEIAKISFFTNDANNNTFSFLAMGSGSMAASINTAAYDLSNPEGVNTVPLGDADGNGTRFITSVAVTDPNKVINQEVKLIVKLTFEDKTTGQITKTMYEVGPGALTFVNGILKYGFSVRYGSKNMFVDVEAYLEFANGEVSNKLKYRIIRPLGAN